MFNRFREAGKRHSATDMAAMQTIHDLAAEQGAVCGMGESAPTIHPGVEAACTEAGMSFGDISNLVRMALKAEYPGKDTYVWPRDVYADSVVYDVTSNGEDALYQRSYALMDGKVTFGGDAVRVAAVTNYVPVSESGDPVAEAAEITGDLIPLSEKAVAKDGTIRIKVIQAGQGSSGWYPEDVLKRDGPKAFTAGLHMHLDHPSASEEIDRPERSVTTLAGTLTSNARWEEAGPAGPGLYADAKVRSDLAPLIEELAPHIGVSIRALGKAGTREIGGQKVRTIEAIDSARSVDFVTDAGAGGKVLDLVESARHRQQGGAPPERTNDVSQEELDATKQALAEAVKRLDEQSTELARIKERALLAEAAAIVREQLAGTSLPQMTRDRIASSLARFAPLTDAGALDAAALKTAVDEAATAEMAYLAGVTGGNPVRGMGATPIKEEDATAGLVESFKARGFAQEIAERMAAL